MASEGGRRGGGAIRELSYGDSGNTATDGRGGRALAFDYDQADRLVAVTDGGILIATYTHNAMGQRVAKDTGAATVHYVYDSAGRLIAEHDGVTGAVIAEYVWLGGAPLAYVRNGATYWVHGDHLGTPQLLTDGAGRIAWSAIYRPFGETAHVGGQVTFNLRFPGQYFDAETGLHYNYYRDYDPTLGRYVQSDPIGLEGGWNTYAYVGGNPVMRVDPEGLIELLFDRSSGTLTAYLDNGTWLTTCNAANNTTASSRGPWTDGVYNYDYSKIHPENIPAYGSYGIHIFDYPPVGGEPRRTGMGIHSGRRGPQSKTLGCIRTTDDCMGYISFIHATYEKIRKITVITAVADVGE